VYIAEHYERPELDEHGEPGDREAAEADMKRTASDAMREVIGVLPPLRDKLSTVSAAYTAIAIIANAGDATDMLSHAYAAEKAMIKAVAEFITETYEGLMYAMFSLANKDSDVIVPAVSVHINDDGTIVIRRDDDE
jgi:hypothetical protein